MIFTKLANNLSGCNPQWLIMVLGNDGYWWRLITVNDDGQRGMANSQWSMIVRGNTNNNEFRYTWTWKLSRGMTNDNQGLKRPLHIGSTARCNDLIEFQGAQKQHIHIGYHQGSAVRNDAHEFDVSKGSQPWTSFLDTVSKHKPSFIVFDHSWTIFNALTSQPTIIKSGQQAKCFIDNGHGQQRPRWVAWTAISQPPFNAQKATIIDWLLTNK